MSNNSIFDDEPPPSYEEATGRPTNNTTNDHHGQVAQGLPPPTPPRAANQKPNSAHVSPGTHAAGGPASSPTASPHTPAQTFQQILPLSQTVNQQFPPAFNLYRDAFPGQRSYFLGEHQATPLYSITTWAGWSTGAHLVLHNGPSEDHPPLATVVYDPWGRSLSVNLPPLPGHAPAAVSVQTPALMSAKFAFAIEVPWPGAGAAAHRKERFEWRRSNSLAVGGLAGRSQGWKLVRLSNELPPAAPGGRAFAGGGPPSGDGHEVVAVCTDAVMSVTKLFKFSFLGTGLSGALGERWAVMAVATGLVMWDRERRGG